MVLTSRLSSLQVCEVLWQILQVTLSNFQSSQTSVKVLTYWNTSFQLMVPVRVFLIQRLEQPIQDTLQEDLLMFLRTLSSERQIVVLARLYLVCMFTHLSMTEQLTQVMPRKIFLSHYRRELQEDILLKISRTQLQVRLSLQLTTL